jgi:hypothetical protein
MGEISIFGTQFTASAVIVFIGRVLEQWIPATAAFPSTLKRAVYWIIAALSALGVHAAFTSSTGTLVITGLTVGGMLGAAWHWIQSVALQEFVHRSTKEKAKNP